MGRGEIGFAAPVGPVVQRAELFAAGIVGDFVVTETAVGQNAVAYHELLLTYFVAGRYERSRLRHVAEDGVVGDGQAVGRDVLYAEYYGTQDIVFPLAERHAGDAEDEVERNVAEPLCLGRPDSLYRLLGVVPSAEQLEVAVDEGLYAETEPVDVGTGEFVQIVFGDVVGIRLDRDFRYPFQIPERAGLVDEPLEQGGRKKRRGTPAEEYRVYRGVAEIAAPVLHLPFEGFYVILRFGTGCAFIKIAIVAARFAERDMDVQCGHFWVE